MAIGAGLAVVAKVGFDELAEGQKVAAQTTAVLKSTGGAANVTAQQVDELSEALMKKSGVDDEVIASGQNVLLTFTNIRNEVGKGNDVFTQATTAILDMSVALGTDMQNATVLVGKALNDPIRGLTALRRVGVSFTQAQEKQITALVESGKTMEAQKVILAELNKEFGGSAEAAGKTLPGQLNIAKESFANLSGELVANLLPAFTRLTELLLRAIEYLQRNPKVLKAVVVGLGALAAALTAASVAQLALNLAVLANPYVAAAAALIALGVAITILVKKVDFFKDHWQLLLIVIGAGPVIIATVVKAIIRHFGTLEAAFNKVKSVAKIAFEAVAASVRLIIAPVLAAIEAVRTLIDFINAIPDINRSIAGGGAGTGAPVGRGARPPRGASGGDILRSGLAHVHQGERIVPARLVNRGLRQAAGGGEVRVIVVGGDQQAISYLQELDKGHKRSNGGRGVFG